MKRSGVVVTWNSHCCNLHVSLQIEILVNYMHAGLKCFITKTVTVYVQFIIFIIYRQSQVECGLRALYCSLRLLKYKTMACQNFVLFQGETRPWNEGIIQIYKLSTLEVQKNVFSTFVSCRCSPGSAHHIIKTCCLTPSWYWSEVSHSDSGSMRWVLLFKCLQRQLKESLFRSVSRLLSSL